MQHIADFNSYPIFQKSIVSIPFLSAKMAWDIQYIFSNESIVSIDTKFVPFLFLFILFFIIFSMLGLDPAYPLYVFSGPSARLTASDAKFVDIIHTDGGVLGYPWAIGHADFFPNGGTPLQPGCVEQEISKNRWFNVIGEIFCFFK